MSQLMKAIVQTGTGLTVQDVAKPQTAEPGHVLVKMTAAAINRGDKFFLNRPMLPGAVKSQLDIKGVSGVGTVLKLGQGVPQKYLGRQVTMYKQLSYSETVIGIWSEYALVPFLDCVILPEDVDAKEYSGALVNIITPLAFLNQIREEGHKGIISTAGNSATGKAMLGICLAYGFPLVSIVRTEESKKGLESLGAKHVVAQDSPHVKEELNQLAQQLSTTAVFDGVGGQILNEIIGSLPNGCVIYAYGFIGDAVPLTIHTNVLVMKNMAIKPFANTATKTVKDPARLQNALDEIGGLIHQPHFKTKVGKEFSLAEINEALTYQSDHGEKATLVFDK